MTNALTMSRLPHRPNEPAYYILDCWIFEDCWIFFMLTKSLMLVLPHENLSKLGYFSRIGESFRTAPTCPVYQDG